MLGATALLLSERALSAQQIVQPDAPTPAAFMAVAEEMRALALANGDQGYGAIVVRDGAGEIREATTYRSPNPGGPFAPSAAYTRPILAGARELGLPDDYVHELEAIISRARA